MSQVIPLPLTVVELKTLEAAKALMFASDLSLGKVILEGDSETIINSLNYANNCFNVLVFYMSIENEIMLLTT